MRPQLGEPTSEPGWRPHPFDPALERYHDGYFFTDEVRPAPGVLANLASEPVADTRQARRAQQQKSGRDRAEAHQNFNSTPARSDGRRPAGAAVFNIASVIGILLAVFALGCLLHLWTDWQVYRGATGGSTVRAALEDPDFDVWTHIAWYATVVPLALTPPLWLVWQVLARRANEVFATEVRLPVIMHVLGWVIPVANLALPYMNMADLWRGATETPEDSHRRRRSGAATLKLWWFLVLANSGVAVVTYWLLPDVSVADAVDAVKISAFSHGLQLLVAIFAIGAVYIVSQAIRRTADYRAGVMPYAHQIAPQQARLGY